jgi:RNA polymerase sigma-70 factor (ECF subfamily)
VSQDNAEFAEFFAASWDPCLRAVAASTGNMTLAEDQVAEAFARAWASWRKVSRRWTARAGSSSPAT